MKTNSKRIVVIGGSSSTTSINRTFALYAASQIHNIEVVDLDLNGF